MAKTDIEVKIIGADGNIFNLLGICRRALQKANRMDLWNEFYAEATSAPLPPLPNTLKSVQPRKTENTESRQRGFFSYMLFTQPPLLRPDLPLSRQTTQEYLQGGSAVML